MTTKEIKKEETTTEIKVNEKPKEKVKAVPPSVSGKIQVTVNPKNLTFADLKTMADFQRGNTPLWGTLDMVERIVEEDIQGWPFDDVGVLIEEVMKRLGEAMKSGNLKRG